MGSVSFGSGPGNGALLFVCNCSGCGVRATGNSCGGAGFVGEGCVGVVGYGGCYAGVSGESGGAGPGVRGLSVSCSAGVQGESRYGPALLGISCGGVGLMLQNMGNNLDKTSKIQFQNGCIPSVCWYAGVGGPGNSSGLTSGQFFIETQCVPRLTVNKCGNVGVGTIAPVTTLDVNGSISAKAANITAKDYEISSTDFAIFVNASSNSIVIGLPPAEAAAGRVLFIKRTDKTSNRVTISRSGTNTIEGKTSVSMNGQYASFTLISNGSEWFILSNAT